MQSSCLRSRWVPFTRPIHVRVFLFHTKVNSVNLPACFGLALVSVLRRDSPGRRHSVHSSSIITNSRALLFNSLRRARGSALVRHTLTWLRLVYKKLRLRGVFDEELGELYCARKQHVCSPKYLRNHNHNRRYLAQPTSLSSPSRPSTLTQGPLRQGHAPMQMQTPTVYQFNMFAAVGCGRLCPSGAVSADAL